MQLNCINVIRIFSGNNPFNIIILFFLGILLRMPHFSDASLPYSGAEASLLYKHLFQWLQSASAYFSGIHAAIAYVLVFLQAIILNSFVNDQKLFSQPNYLTAFCYLLISSMFAEWTVFSPGLVINTFLVWAWAKMAGLYLHSKPKTALFNLGLGFGICSFVYFQSVYLMLLLFVALFIFRPFQVTEWLVSIMGLLTPYYFLLIYFFVWGRWDQVVQVIPPQVIGLPALFMSNPMWVTALLLIIPLLVGWWMSIRNLPRLVVQLRKTWSFMFFFLLVSLLIPFVNTDDGLEAWMLALVPVTVYHTAFYHFPHSKSTVGWMAWLSIGWVLVNYLFLSP